MIHKLHPIIKLILFVNILLLNFVFICSKDYYVDTQNPIASDENPGTKELPLKTIIGARDIIRIYKADNGGLNTAINVWLRAGTYLLTDTIAFTAADSGTSSYTISYQAYPGEKVIVTGKKKIPFSSFAPVVASNAQWSQIDAVAKPNLLSVNLNTLGINNFGTQTVSNDPPLLLFINKNWMPLARWPDKDTNRVSSAMNNTIEFTGVTTPAVAGIFDKIGTSDGVNSYKRRDLVGGVQFYLYRMYWNYLGFNYRAWFLTTQTSGYPGPTVPFWYIYAENPNALSPGTNATGTLSINGNMLYQEGAISNGFIGFYAGNTTTSFFIPTDRISRWATAPDAVVHGFMYWLWSDSLSKITAIDIPNRKITLENVPVYGINDTQGGRLFVYNLIEEITEAGEWYLNKASGELYLWPPVGFNSSSDIEISMLNKPLVSTTNTSYILFKNLDFEGGRERSFLINSGQKINIDSCRIINSGTDGITVLYATQSSIQNSMISGVGSNGITFYAAGSRVNLTESNDLIQNCVISNVGAIKYTGSYGVQIMECVGVKVLHNEMSNGAHSAIIFSGNENLFQWNKISGFCKKASDAGAIYAGRDWSYRGNLVKNNYIFNIQSEVGSDVHGVYFDDVVSGSSIIGNIFSTISGYAIEHGGGRDVTSKYNVFYKCGVAAYHLDDRGRVQITNDAPGSPNYSWNFFARMINAGIDYKAEPWASKYPRLFAIPNDWAIASDPVNKWFFPGGSIISGNIGYKNTTFLHEGRTVDPNISLITHLKEYADNLENTDPIFKDEAGLNFQLMPNSPAFKIAGFQDIPFNFIGLLNKEIVFNSATPASPVSAEIGASQTYTILVTDPDGDTLSYVWDVDGQTIVSSGNSLLYSTSALSAGVQSLSVQVSDGRGSVYKYTWQLIISNIPVYKLETTTTVGGSISPLGVTLLERGKSQVISVTVETGYLLSTFTRDGVSANLTTDNKYTVSNIQADTNLSVTFVKKKLTVTVTSNEFGKVNYNNQITVDYGDDIVFQLTPNDGCEIKAITLNGVELAKTSSLLVSKVSENVILDIVFAKKKFNVNIASNSGGSFTPSTAPIMESGSILNVAITPSEGFFVEKVTVNQAIVNITNNSLELTILEETSIEIKFAEMPKIIDLAFTKFTFANAYLSIIGEESIQVFMPSDSEINQLKAVFERSVGVVYVDYVLQTSEISVKDFSNEITYTIVDALRSKNYKIKVIQLAGLKDISSILTFLGVETASEISIIENEIQIIIPTGESPVSMPIYFMLNSGTITIDGVPLVSGVSKIDFSTPKEIIITDQNNQQKIFTVTASYKIDGVITPILTGENNQAPASSSGGGCQYSPESEGDYSWLLLMVIFLCFRLLRKKAFIQHLS
jgi:hypothetical protein